jgi:hypothetical protein
LRRDRLLDHVHVGPRLVVDDRNNPSLYVRPDGRVMVFYSEHNGKHLYYRTSAQPYSIRRMSRAHTIATNRRGWWGYTYPNPVRVDGHLWLMFRGADWQPDFTVNRGGQWTPARNSTRRDSHLERSPDRAPGRRPIDHATGDRPSLRRRAAMAA